MREKSRGWFGRWVVGYASVSRGVGHVETRLETNAKQGFERATGSDPIVDFNHALNKITSTQ